MIRITANVKDVKLSKAAVAVNCKHDRNDLLLNSFEIVAILRRLRDTFDDAFMLAMEVLFKRR